MKKISPITEDVFEISFFNSCLNQSGIDDYNRIVWEYNELINLYNQEQKDKSERLSLFKILYKQIGAKNAETFQILSFQNDDEFLTHISKKFIPEALQKNEEIEKIFKNFSSKTEEDFEKIYLSKAAINTISNKIFANWFLLSEILIQQKIWNLDTEGNVKIPETTSLGAIFQAMNHFSREEIFRENLLEKFKDFNGKNSEIFIKILISDVENIVSENKKYSENLEKILQNFQKNNTEHKAILKDFADSSRIPASMLKYFLVKKLDLLPNDTDFYGQISNLLADFRIFASYDAVRNYITKAEISNEKMKLNFENGTLAAGWDINKERDNYCVILENEKWEQFLAITTKKENKFFEKNNSELYKTDGNGWKKMNYKLLPWPNKMLPKCLLPKSNPKKYGATDEILEIYNSGAFKKTEKNFSQEKLWKMIDFYKVALQKYEDWQVFNFNFKNTEKYEDVSQFYKDVEIAGYKLDFTHINKSEIDKWIEDGKIFLFQIKNRDFNTIDGKAKNSSKNLHTLYWQAIFSNLPNKPKLNGEAEIFYRKAFEPTYKQNKKWEKIINKFRFSREKFLFHIPITLNFCLDDKKIDDKIRQEISLHENINTIGIDRWEKHLLFYSVTDSSGEILEQGSLNEIFEWQNYNKKLSQVAKNRDEARKSWQTIGTIKELKEWYISQAVKKIADLAIQYNAIIVMEDLNTGFKRGRQKIEKSIYQKFELALAKKLNFLVFKNANNGEIASVTNAYQLTPPVENYWDIENKKQVWNIFYTRANYTSQTDPVTGWRKSIYLPKNVTDLRSKIIENFSEISYEKGDYIFEYSDSQGRKWQMHTLVNNQEIERYRGSFSKEKNIWQVEKVNVRAILDEILQENFDFNRSILSQIEEWIEPKSWSKFRFVIDILMQIRNTGDNELNSDFLLSPVSNENGEFYDSRKFLEKNPKEITNFEKLPTSGDANGAYNIARKWQLMIDHIRYANKNGVDYKDLSLYVSDAEWDLYLANSKNWSENLENFASRKNFEKFFKKRKK